MIETEYRDYVTIRHHNPITGKVNKKVTVLHVPSRYKATCNKHKTAIENKDACIKAICERLAEKESVRVCY